MRYAGFLFYFVLKKVNAAFWRNLTRHIRRFVRCGEWEGRRCEEIQTQQRHKERKKKKYLPPRNPRPRTMLALGIEFRFFCTEVFRWSTINAYIGKINPVVWYLNGTDQDEFSLTYATGFSFISAKLFPQITSIWMKPWLVTQIHHHK